MSSDQALLGPHALHGLVGAVGGDSSFSSIQVDYFSASGIWTKPEGCIAVAVEYWGGGGAGWRVPAGDPPGASGGGAATQVALILADDLSSSESLIIGAGGDGTIFSQENPGGNTSFGSLPEATGGGGARSLTLPGLGGVANLSGAVVFGVNGGNGEDATSNVLAFGGDCWATQGPGGGGSGTANPQRHGTRGAGGSGAFTNRAGGNGGDGGIIVYSII